MGVSLGNLPRCMTPTRDVALPATVCFPRESGGHYAHYLPGKCRGSLTPIGVTLCGAWCSGPGRAEVGVGARSGRAEVGVGVRSGRAKVGPWSGQSGRRVGAAASGPSRNVGQSAGRVAVRASRGRPADRAEPTGSATPPPKGSSLERAICLKKQHQSRTPN